MNNNYDEIDNLLFSHFKNNDDTPDLIINGINTALNIKNKKYKICLLLKRFIITITGFLTITCGVVFAKDIKIFVNDLMQNIFGNYNDGITTAIENGYSQDIEMEYIESNNIQVKANQITLDDYNLGIVFNIKINSKDNLYNLFNIQFKNLLIMDENKNVLFAEYENQDDFIKYCEINNLDKGPYGIGYANCGANGKILNNENGDIVYSFYTTSEGFPNSKNLTIKFNKIYLLNNKVFDEESNTRVDNTIATFDGSWEMNIDLEKMSTNRKTIEYSTININDDKTIVNTASLSMSNMRLELITSSDKIDFKKLQERKNVNVTDMIPFHDVYIETSDRKKFFQTNSGGIGYETIQYGKIKYYVTFDYTYFDKSSEIKIVLPTNKNQELVIELKENDLKAQ